MVFGFKQIILFLLPLFVASCDFASQSKTHTERNINVEFHDGDIALRRGCGIASHAVLMTNSRASYSHIGLVVRYKDKWCVVHAVPYEGKVRAEDKVYCEPVEDFFEPSKAVRGAVYTLALDSAQRATVCEYAMRQFERKVPFDHDYDLEDSTKLYCSELVWRSYLEIGMDVSGGRRTEVNLPSFSGIHIMPGDIEAGDSLKLVWQFAD